MRRILAAIAAAVLLVLFAAVPASGAEPVVPVTPIPELPSNTIRMTPTASGTWTAADWWKTVLWKSVQPGTTVATIPTTGTTVATVAKPITAPAAFARGAAGGPLVGAFMGGFAIGTAGLELYGAITGDEPLDGLCGSGFEGAASIIYMGMTPDCLAAVEDPNLDANPDSTLTYAGKTLTVQGQPIFNASIGSTSLCMSSPLPLGSSTDPPSGYAYYLLHNNGGPRAMMGTSTVGAPGTSTLNTRCTSRGYPTANVWGAAEAGYLASTLHIRNTTTGVTVATIVPGDGDPERTPRCRIQWEDGSTTVSNGTPYNESDGIPLSSRGLGCEQAFVSKPGAGPELLPDSITVESDQGGAITEIATQQVPDMSPEQRRGLEAVPGNGRGLVLERTVDGSVKSCNTWEVSCAQWWTTTGEGTTPGEYRCTYGGAAVSLVECGPYRHTFDSPTSTPTITDPSTGQPVPWPTPTPGQVADGVTGGGGCAAAWSLNPVDWVVNPMKCLFIPSQTAVTTMQTSIATAWAPTVFGQLPLVVADAFAPPEGMEGCEGPHIYMPFSNFYDGWVDVNWYPLQACEAPMSEVAAAARVIGSGILIYLTALGIVRRFSSIVQAPGLGSAAGSA